MPDMYNYRNYNDAAYTANKISQSFQKPAPYGYNQPQQPMQQLAQQPVQQQGDGGGSVLPWMIPMLIGGGGLMLWHKYGDKIQNGVNTYNRYNEVKNDLQTNGRKAVAAATELSRIINQKPSKWISWAIPDRWEKNYNVWRNGERIGQLMQELSSSGSAAQKNYEYIKGASKANEQV